MGRLGGRGLESEFADSPADAGNGAGAKLLAGASLIAIGMFAATPAWAQEAATQQEEGQLGNETPPETGTSDTQEPEVATTEGDTIVVTGIRQSLRSARNIKRDAEQFVDSITAQDIGALPDRSVSEALQRIPGVTLQRTNEARDPARLAAEGGGIFIRGLTWVRSEVNGRDVFSANNGRALNFEDVSSDLLAGVDVYKNPAADMVEGGIGGLVNLRTRKPFDQTGQMFAFALDRNHADLKDEEFWSGSGLYSNRWGTGLGEIGILLSASINNIGNRTDSVQTGDYTARGAGGTGPFVPVTFGFRSIDWRQKRTAFSGSLQWAPTPDLQFTAEAIRAKATPRDLELNVGDYFSPLPSSDASYTFDDEGVLQSGTVGGRLLDNNTRFGERINKTRDYSLNARFTPTDRWTFSADVQRVKSLMDLRSMTTFVQPATPFTVDFDLSGDTPQMTYTPAGGTQPQQSDYWWAAAMDHHEKNEAEQWAYRADAEYDLDGSPFLKSFKFGARATDRDALSRSTGWNWGILSRQHWGGAGAQTSSLNEFGGEEFAPGAPNLFLPAQVLAHGFPNFMRGDIAPRGSFWFAGEDLVSNGTENAYSYLQSTLNGGWGWAPLGEEAWDPVGGENIQNEKTAAGYGLLRFGSDGGGLGRFDGNIGMRVVQTKSSAENTGVQINAGGQMGTPEGRQALLQACLAANPAATCAPLQSAVTFLAAGADTIAETIPADNKYTDILPSLNLRFFLQDDLLLRFAAGRAISRPSFVQLNPFTSLNFNFTAAGVPSPTGAFTGIGASPTLRPIKSTQFDGSVEWYFGDTGQLSGAVFYKRIRDFIFAGNETVSLTANGQTVDFAMTTLMNGERGSVKGFELAYQQFYDFLPGALSGLGLQANFTLIDSEGGRNTVLGIRDPNQVAGSDNEDLPLEGMSKHSYNLALMYNRFGIDARLAWNWRSKYLLTTSAANINRPVWAEDYGQLDGSIFYSVTENVKVGLQGYNLLRARTFLDVGGAERHPRYSWTDTDRRIAAIVRTQF